MANKICTSCSIEKSIEYYYQNKAECKECSSVRSKEFRRTPKGLAAKLFETQLSSSKRRGHQMPNYTKAEFVNWILNHPDFEMLYTNWVKSNFSKWLKPSVDRKDDSIGYSMDNIELMTWKENDNKANLDMRSGKLKHGHTPQKPIIGTNLETGISTRYPSVREAARILGVANQNISTCARGKYQKAYGHTWKFENIDI